MSLLVSLGLRPLSSHRSQRDVPLQSDDKPSGLPRLKTDPEQPDAEPTLVAAAAGGGGDPPRGPGWAAGGHRDDGGGGADGSGDKFGERGRRAEDRSDPSEDLDAENGADDRQGDESEEDGGEDEEQDGQEGDDSEGEPDTDDGTRSLYVERDSPPGWAEEKRTPDKFPKNVVVHLGGSRFLATDLDNIDFSIGAKLKEPSEWIFRIGETKEALVRFRRSEQGESSEEQPDAPESPYDTSYAGDKPSDDLKLPKPYVDQHSGLEHRYKKVNGSAYGSGGGPDPEDVVQGLGNCYFMASLSALASTTSGKALLTQLVQQLTKRSDGKVEAYLPALREHDGKEILAGASYGADANKPPPLWPAVIEQAFAAKRGGYNKMDGGEAHHAFEFLEVSSETILVLRMPPNKLKQWFHERNGCAFVVGTPMSFGGKGGGPAMKILGGQKKVAFVVPVWGLEHITCMAVGEAPRRVKVDSSGKVTCESILLGRLVDGRGNPPGEDPGWTSALMEYEADVDPPSYVLSCNVAQESLEGLSAKHEYAVVAVDDAGVTLRDPQAKQSRKLTYDQISRTMAWASAAGEIPARK